MSTWAARTRKNPKFLAMAIETPKPGDVRTVNGIVYRFGKHSSFETEAWDGGLLGGKLYQNNHESDRRKGRMFFYSQWRHVFHYRTFDDAADALQKSLYNDYCASKEHISAFEKQLAAADAAYRQAMQAMEI